MKNGLFLLLCSTMHLFGLYEYDRAAYAGQQERWKDAKEYMHSLVAQQPDNAQLLYDAGVIAYKNEDYQQAKAYFDAAPQKDSASRQLKEQAYYNKGNAHVALQELKDALLSYEQTLMLNPENEAAKHNHEVIKKLLDQQKQQQQNQDKNQQNQDQNQENQDEQQQQDKQKQDRSQDDQNDCQKDQSSSDGDSDDERNDEKKEEQQQDSQDDSLDQEGNQKDGKQGGSDPRKEQSNDDIKRDGSGNPKQDTQGKEDKQDQGKDHQSPPEQDTQQQDMQPSGKEQEFDEQAGAAAHLDPKLQEILEQRSDRDAKLSKQLVKALVNQEMKGQHGQNNW